MSILNSIKALFKNFSAKPDVLLTAEGVARLKNRYGEDFMSFLYKPEIDNVIRFEIPALLAFRKPYHDFFRHDHWPDKHPFNFPGPFYTGQSDSCGTGDIEAPENVMYGLHCCEYVFRQPRNFAELSCVFEAAAVEVLDSYSCNGNKYWTYELCKEWWRNRFDLIAQLYDPEVKRFNGGRIHLYIDYLNSEAETDLKRYCFFLENNYYPNDININLPDL